MQNASPELKKKSTSIKKRIQKSVDLGVVLILKEEAADVIEITAHACDEGKSVKAPQGPSLNEIMATLEAKKGDICCFQIFRDIEDFSSKFTHLLENPPRFFKRQGFERTETFSMITGKNERS